MKGKKENKEKSRRLYNVFFNTHTVSGIVISMGLYIIFLAGAFALYQNHINNWEINAPEAYFTPDLDYDRILEEVAKEGYQLYGRDITINLTSNSGRYISVFSSRPANKISNDSLSKLSKEDSIAYTKATARLDYILEPGTYKLVTPANTNDADKRIGRLLTKLHYFQQIPVVGIFLSGFVSIFFLFSMVSGVIIHWKKIVSNFFTFRLRSTIKNLWTDAHTALGILGIPFQLMYALTGTAFGLGIVVFPIAMMLYGNVNKSTEVLLPERAKYKLMGESPNVAINPLVQDAMVDIPEKDIENWRVMIKAFGDKNAHLDVVVHTESKEDFSGKATATYKLSNGAVVRKESQNESSYRTASVEYFQRLHFANFGGHIIRAIYFLLALLTCFVIITGVMIWLTAREKKTYANKAKFNKNVGAIYLGACLGLFPAIAVLFIITKVLPMEMENRFAIINWVFFGFWLTYLLYGFVIKDYHKINKHALLLTGFFGVVIPIINGLVTGLWPWKSLPQGYVDSFFVDVSWFLLGAISLWVGLKVKRLVTYKKEMPKKNQSVEFLQ